MFDKKNELAQARNEMVQKQLKARSITDERILEAMREIPRHLFVRKELWRSAYNDRPLPIGHGQTISQPYIVAYMIQALQLPPDNQAIVLEIGAGSGYQAAILSRLAAKVYGIERIAPLAAQAQQVIEALGIDNVEIKVGDGSRGWPEHSPYDAIITAAAAPEIPAPLTTQLKEGGVLVAPVGPRWQQELLRVHRREDRITQERLVPVAFVPLIGEHGWAEED